MSGSIRRLFDGAIRYTTGDPYDADHFTGKALELQALGADMITDKDMDATEGSYDSDALEEIADLAEDSVEEDEAKG